jgi:hypothetical protein
VLVSGEQKHFFHLWGLQKPLVIFSVPTRENNVFTLLPLHSNTTFQELRFIEFN